MNWDILGLSEVRRADENIVEHDNYMLYYKSIFASLYGVGFIVNKYHKKNIIKFQGVSDRIAVLNINLPGYKQPTSIVQINAPTEIAKEKQKTIFATCLMKLCRTCTNMQ